MRNGGKNKLLIYFKHHTLLFITLQNTLGITRPSSSLMEAVFSLWATTMRHSSQSSIDYRGLNNVILMYKYPLLLINATSSPLLEASIFVELELLLQSLCQNQEMGLWERGICPRTTFLWRALIKCKVFSTNHSIQKTDTNISSWGQEPVFCLSTVQSRWDSKLTVYW